MQIIPDVISLPGIPLCFLCSFVVPWTTPLESAIGILVGGGVLYGVAAGYYYLRKKDGMGGGDIKLLAMIGAFLGWKGALIALVVGAFAGSIIGVTVMLLKGKDMKYAIPFGPFLSFGALLLAAVRSGTAALVSDAWKRVKIFLISDCRFWNRYRYATASVEKDAGDIRSLEKHPAGPVRNRLNRREKQVCEKK